MSRLTYKTGEFTLTEDHLKLIRELNIGWMDYAYDGAPGVDCKRPFGNSDWVRDVYEHLGWDMPQSVKDGEEGLEDADPEGYERAKRLFRELDQALQIVVQQATIDPGRFDVHMYGSWHERVTD